MASNSASSAALNKGPTSLMKKRLMRVVASVLALFTLYITCNLAKISIVDTELYQNLANSQHLSPFPIYANRGTIYDATGQILAKSATTWTIVMSPNDLRKNDEGKEELIAKALAEILDMDYDRVYAMTQNDNKYTTVKTKVEKPECDEITQFMLDNGISSSSLYQMEGTKRYYPNGTLAANVIGFTNDDNVGIYGVEAYYDEYLSGVNGKIVSAQDAGGNEMPYRYKKLYDAQNGNDLYLTLDATIQHYLEKALEKTVEQHKVQNRATGIVMNVKTGAVLAMATSPSFDLNTPFELYDDQAVAYIEQLSAELEKPVAERAEEYKDLTEEYINSEYKRLQEAQWKNKAITELYYPGSVFKTITASSALEEGAITPQTTFTCTGAYNVAGTIFHCWKLTGHGTLDLQNALIVSCNPYFMQVGQSLGVDKFTEYFRAYGLAEKTGIDLPGEVSSLYYSRENMGPVELVSSSFGQSNKITPMQMITAFAAVINGGNLVTPHVVDKVIDGNGNTVYAADENIKRQVISEETSATMRQLLENVVNTNGGNNAYIQGYRIGGKSGTSEKQDQTVQTGQAAYMGSFVGFAPADDPEIIMLVMVDEPTGGQIYGSQVAAPVVSAVFKEALPYLGYYPQYTKEELEQLEVTVPYVIGKPKLNAQAALSAAGLECIIEGSGETVVDQYPYSGTPVPRNGAVVLYTEQAAQAHMVTVPSVLGMTVEQANVALANAGLNIKLSGGAINNASAKATMQSTNAGESVRIGTIIEVVFVVQENDGLTGG